MIPLNVQANLRLVDKGVRPAMLIQPQDYNEEKNGKITTSILSFIHAYYPSLICTDTYEIYQGIIVSTKKYASPISLDKMGQLLGYFCEFKQESTYAIRAMLYGKENCELFVNTCMTLDELPKFENFAVHANKVLSEMGTVKIEYTKIVSIQDVVSNLHQNKVLTEDDFHRINLSLQSLFNTNSIPAICDVFDYDNKFHRGILATLLLMEKYPIASPFYPVSPEKNNEMTEIAIAMEASIISLLTKKIGHVKN
jgi:hypothetical protein